MNLIEKYVSNITYSELKHNDKNNFDYYEVIADTDSYGVKKKQEKLIMPKDTYEFMMKNGYYLV